MAADHKENSITIEQIAADIKEQIPRLKDIVSVFDLEETEFFKLVDLIPEFTNQGMPAADIMKLCLQSAAAADQLQKQTSDPAFTTWAEQLREYAATFLPEGSDIDTDNYFLQAEQKALNISADHTQHLPLHKSMEGFAYMNFRQQLSDFMDNTITLVKDIVSGDSGQLSENIEKLLQAFHSLDSKRHSAERGEAFYDRIAEFTTELYKLKAKSAAIRIMLDNPGIEPFLNEELQKDKYGGLSLADLIEESTGDNGELLPDSLCMQALNAAKEALERNSKLPPEEQVKYYTHATADTAISLNSKAANEYLTIQDKLLQLVADGQQTLLQVTDTPGVKLQVRNEVKNKKTGKIIKKSVFTVVSLEYTGDLDGKLAKIKQYDRSILNAICSLWAAGNQIMTREDIYYFMTRKNRRKTRPTEKQLERINLALKKYAGTRITLDVSNEIEAGLLVPDGQKITPFISEALLNYREYGLINETSGKKVSAVEFLDAPILYQYSMAKTHPQIVSYPAEWLDLPGISATEETIILRDFLLKEIKQMQGGFRDNHTINYNTLLSLFDIKESDLEKKYKGDFTKKVSRLLDAMKDKGIIKQYTQRTGKKGRIEGFTIEI